MAPGALYLETDHPARCVLIDQGRVASVGKPCPNGVPRLDCGGAEIRAGYVNAHTHLYSGLVPFGMPPPAPTPENFLQILERIWWRLDRALDPASLRAAARYYVADALLHGTTMIVDHHESPGFIHGSLEVLADACQKLGIRALLCYGATERNRGAEEAREGLAECERFCRSNRRPLVQGLVGLHASFTVSDETIHDAGRLCRDLDTVLHVHVAEDTADAVDAEHRGYAGPLERLLALESLEKGSILAHGVHLNQTQVQTASERGSWLVQNPRSNLGNRVGYPEALWASERVALGTDGYPAHMPEEQAALVRATENLPEVERRAAARRLEDGARLLAERWGKPFGAIVPGSLADIIVVPDGETRARHVIVDGQLVVQDSVLKTGPVDAIQAEAARQAEALWRRMDAVS